MVSNTSGTGREFHERPALPANFFERPAVARLQDYLDHGRDNYLPDRQLAHQLLAAAPWVRDSVRINRTHGARVLDYFSAGLGIDQVVDLGCGLPHEHNNRRSTTFRRMVYVDNDPVVEAHARMVLAEPDGADTVLADLTDVPALAASSPFAELDHHKPVGILLHDVLPWLDDRTARTTLRMLHGHLPPRSVLSLTHATGDFAHPDQVQRLVETFEHAGMPFRPRSPAAIEDLLGPWEPLDGHGLVATADWQPPRALVAPPPLLHAQRGLSHAYATLVTTGDRTP
ncbi:SAM-dependent methyltransferase [Streptomyces albidoflavus]